MTSKPYLYRGVDNEAAVKALQRQLNLFLREKGKKIIEDDGDFGRATEAALKSFKSEILGIRKPDGKVADFTHDMLDKYYPLPIKEKARPAEKVTKKPSAEPSTEEKDDEPKKKSGSGWNPISSFLGLFTPTKKEKPEAKLEVEPASEREHPVEKPTPAKSVVEPTPEKPTPAKSDRKQPKPEKPKLEKPDINPTPAKRDVNGDSYSRYNSSTGQLADINDLSQDGPANPIKKASLTLSSDFGLRIKPNRWATRKHPGVDIPADYGTPVYATMDGRVDFAGRAGNYGNFITIDEPGPLSSGYGHLQKILVRSGQEVKKGDLIGLVGSTGNSTGPHLHYEVRYNGVPVNPLHHGLVLKPLHLKKPEPPINHYFMAREDREDGLPQSRSLLLLGGADRDDDKPFSGQLLNANMLTVPSGKFPSQHAGSNGVPTEKPATTPKSNSPLSWLGL